jgi:hypothetical protein
MTPFRALAAQKEASVIDPELFPNLLAPVLGSAMRNCAPLQAAHFNLAPSANRQSL